MARRVLIPPTLPPSLPLGGGHAAREVWDLTGTTMGTYWRARVVESDGVTAEKAAALLGQVFEFVVSKMSPWENTSDLAKFRSAAARSWVTIDPATFQVLARAMELAKFTEGRFDPTVGRLTDVLGFGPSPIPDPIWPLSPSAEAARKTTKYSRVALDRDHWAIFQPGGVQLDLCSIAKGYAVDLAVEKLAAAGVRSCFVEIGGEARGRGCKPDGQPWWCKVEPPVGSDHGLPETVAAASDLALASSGNTLRKRPLVNGEIGHIVCPLSGHRLDPTLESVTVTADTCMEADGWATALYLMGTTAGKELAAQNHVSALFVIREETGYREEWTPCFDALLR